VRAICNGEVIVGRVERPTAFAADCAHWLGYRPCRHQHAAGLPTCAGCTEYQPTPPLAEAVPAERFEPARLATAARVGVLEMGGLGSHLRTAAVTGALRRVRPAAEILWFTHARGADLLRFVPGVTAVDIETQPVDLDVVRSLDVLLNFEIGPTAASVCATSRCVGGFALNRQGRFAPASVHAERLQRLQIDDAYRSGFTGTMQQVLLEAVGLDPAAGYDLALAPESLGAGRQAVAAAFGGEAPGRLVGLNIGSSSRGMLKRWPADNWLALAALLADADPDRGVLILSGPEDEDIRAEVGAGIGAETRDGRPGIRLVDRLEVGGFLSVVGQLQVLVTADTFALHAARAQRVPVVALVGPMPHRELELGSADRIVGPTLPCAPCYYRCTQPTPGDCMSRIAARRVAFHVEGLLGRGAPPASRGCRLRPGTYRGAGGTPRSARQFP
jgi:ADP-heptose:LPS heptosyltransferase